MKENKKADLSILFICKANDEFSSMAAAFILLHYPQAVVFHSTRDEPFPKELFEWKGDLLISYLSQWIIPKAVLDNASMAAINFHPGPPEYPGIGCTNFAIYNNADVFGVTCHHMEAKVDTGDIVAVKRFPVFENDTVYSITQRCYGEILYTFYEIFYLLMNGEDLPASTEKWVRKPYLRKELNELCRLTTEMDREEIERRIKATTYLQPWAYLEVGEQIYKFTMEDIINRSYINRFPKL
jgi:methionyl-tRNA formyltransferase